ncbi:hypothetical protein ABZ826_30740 [Streptomyces sp. NPDC047515]|uniref:hypothetical protein n=1 Tax=Streptomyces sp. NPDC047515 TaxID=3155380 RepID=UPI0033D8C1EC
MSGGHALSKQDQDIRNALVILEGQMEKMRTAEHTVEGILRDVDGHYKAQSSRVFQDRMRGWIDAYNRVSRKVNDLHASLQSANQQLNVGEDEAIQHASNWQGTDLDGIQSTLAGGSSAS